MFLTGIENLEETAPLGVNYLESQEDIQELYNDEDGQRDGWDEFEDDDNLYNPDYCNGSESDSDDSYANW